MTFTSEDIASFTEFEKNGWEQAACAYHDHWGVLSAQSAEPMLQTASVEPGALVLDVATGAGYVAGAASKMGAVSTGLDFSQAQIELARQVYSDVEFCQGDAQELPFGDKIFDVVVMGFGMNHLPNPEKAAAEAWRVLKPGGVFAFTVWATPKSGEGFGIVLSAIDEHGVPNPSLPAAPPYFRFADEEEVNNILLPAGFSKVSMTTVPQFWRHSTPDQVFDAFNEGAVRATAMLKSQPDEAREIIRKAVRADVSRLKTRDEYLIPVPAALSVGRKQR